MKWLTYRKQRVAKPEKTSKTIAGWSYLPNQLNGTDRLAAWWSGAETGSPLKT
ncbi:hypothetical protein KJ628_06230 [Patescibacteria group bacterium]|nr:hypothetical protein [Patescibacteria group bacterium]